MTPFDPIALLAMLRAFYPIVGPAALARARSERPEYFAGGTIGGREGDKLFLPDGRVFDLIFRVLAIETAWQVLDLTGGGAADADDPFKLEDGPLVGIDLSAYEYRPTPGPTFEELVGAELAALGSPDAALVGAETRLLEGAGEAGRVGIAGGEIEDADGARWQQQAGLHAATPDDVLAGTIGRGGVIDAEERETDYAPPPYHAPAPPGSPPSGGGDGYTDPNTGIDYPGLPQP